MRSRPGCSPEFTGSSDPLAGSQLGSRWGRGGEGEGRRVFSHFFSYNLTSDDVNVKDRASSAGSVSSRSHQRHQEMHSTEGWYRYYIV